MLTKTVPVFTVGNLSRTVEWYRDVLGFKAISNGTRSTENIVLIARDRVEVLLRQGDDFTEKRQQTWDAYFRLTGVDVLAEEIRSKAEILRGPEDTVNDDREIEIRDPNGYVLVFAEWQKKQDDVVFIYDLHPVLPVGDIQETVDWYKNVLGFKGEPWHKQASDLFAMLHKDQVETFFAKVDRPSQAESPSVHWAIYFRVVGQEIQHLYERVREKATIVRQIDQDFKGYTEFEVADNNGHVLCFSEMN